MKKTSLFTGLLYFLVISATALNGFLVSSVHAQAMDSMEMGPEADSATASISGASTEEQVWEQIRPTGVPKIYGEALDVSFDDPVNSMPKLIAYDPNKDASVLSEEDLERYVRVGSSISCEYCCGAKTLVFGNGQAACGCAHSKAMRGLTRWLIENSEMSDEQILFELVKWKTLYFPSASVQKTMYLEEQGRFDINTFNIDSVK
ncbi:MAG: hypothetical protein ABIG32_02580 [Candidatus Uhrbacteria bacterium]|nr:hypothetical protein [Patescibacteria group bacterium]MBU1907020.1 hypothetical protein [Patescibacteria group bacterium]